MFLLTGIICSVIWGQIQVSVTTEVHGFIDNSSDPKIIRSSELLHGQTQVIVDNGTKHVKPTKLKDTEKSNYPVNWKNRSFAKFIVKYPDINDEIRTYYKLNIKESNLTVESREFDGNADAWVINIPEDQEKELFRQNWFNKPNLSLEELKKIGIKHLRNNFNQFSGQLEYLNQEVEYELIDDDNIITEVRLRFARRFHDGIVLGNIAYVYIVIDGRGNLKCAKIKWPVFEQAQQIENTRTAISTLNAVESFCQKGEHLKVWGNAAAIQSKNVNISGSARAWVPEKVNGQILISPAFSYSVSTQLEKDEVLSRFVNVPLSMQDDIDQSKFFNVTTAVDKEISSDLFTQIAPTADENNKPISAPVIRNIRMK